MFRHDKMQELNGALAALGLHLKRLSDSYLLRGNTTELRVDVGFSGGANGTYKVRAQVLESGISVIVRWIDAKAKWLVIGSKEYLDSIQGSLKTKSWTQGSRCWSTKINYKTRRFLFDTAGAAGQLRGILAADHLSSAGPQSVRRDSLFAHRDPEPRRSGGPSGTLCEQREKVSVYTCDACIHVPDVKEILSEPVPVDRLAIQQRQMQ